MRFSFFTLLARETTIQMLVFALVALALLAPAHAGNSVLFGANGDYTFPFSPPTATQPGLIDNMIIGATTPRAGTFSSIAAGQITGNSGAATIASGACGTGANGTIAGNSQSGKITIGAVATTACAVVFATALAIAPKACVLFPGNAGAAATGTTLAYLSALSASGFTLTGSALASTIYYYACN